jgi:hypothetical protein
VSFNEDFLLPATRGRGGMSHRITSGSAVERETTR